MFLTATQWSDFLFRPTPSWLSPGRSTTATQWSESLYPLANPWWVSIFGLLPRCCCSVSCLSVVCWFIMICLLLWTNGVLVQYVFDSLCSCKDRASERHRPYRRKKNRILMYIFFPVQRLHGLPGRSTSLYLPENELVVCMHVRQRRRALKESDCGPVHSPMSTPRPHNQKHKTKSKTKTKQEQTKQSQKLNTKTNKDKTRP